MLYSHYRPILKQSNITVGDALAALNPTDNLLADYGIYAGGGGLAGAGIGALVNALRGESKLKGALIGGGIGAGAGAGLKALGNYALSDQGAQIKEDRDQIALLKQKDHLLAREGRTLTHRQNRLNQLEQQELLAALVDSLSKKFG